MQSFAAPADVVGRGKISSAGLCVCTMNDVHAPIMCACRQMIVVDNDLTREGRPRERARVDGGRGGHMEEYGFLGVSVELWSGWKYRF